MNAGVETDVLAATSYLDHLYLYPVCGFNPSEKYESVSWDDYSQLNGKIKFMSQTTNQYILHYACLHAKDGALTAIRSSSFRDSTQTDSLHVAAARDMLRLRILTVEPLNSAEWAGERWGFSLTVDMWNSKQLVL